MIWRVTIEITFNYKIEYIYAIVQQVFKSLKGQKVVSFSLVSQKHKKLAVTND